MYEFQGLIFRSASGWPELTSLAVFAGGLLYLLQGFRFARFLLPLACAGGGLVVGAVVAGVFDLPAAVAWSVAAALGVAALLRFRLALMVSSAFTFGALAQYLAVQLGMRPHMSPFVGAVGLVVGFSLIWVCRRSLPILVTMILGAGLLVLGFVGCSAAVVPSLGLTFIDWSSRLALLVPAVLTMLCVLGYSVQSNAYQGDVETGGSPALRDLETL